MDRFKQCRVWFSVISLTLLVGFIVHLAIPKAETATKRRSAPESIFFVCSNSGSPVISSISKNVESCCDGTVKKKDLNGPNLMRSLKSVSTALRALTRRKNDLLEGPSDVMGKMTCYIDSISYIAGAMKGFDPKKNKDQKAEYDQYLDDLVVAAQKVRDYAQTKSSNKYILAYGYYQETCGDCHQKFR